MCYLRLFTNELVAHLCDRNRFHFKIVKTSFNMHMYTCYYNLKTQLYVFILTVAHDNSDFSI